MSFTSYWKGLTTLSKRAVSIWAIFVIILITPILFEVAFIHRTFDPTWFIYIAITILIGYLWWRANSKASRLSLMNDSLILMNELLKKQEMEQKQSIDKITKLAYFDSLTGLPNRMKLIEMEKHQFMHVLFLDLDRFKLINDTMGHYFGDILLRKIGERIRTAIGSDGEIFRYAGDEFIILVPEEDPTKLARKIISSLKELFYLNEQEVYVSTSIGISSYPKDGETLKELIKNADVAMYVAKELGRNNYHLYDASYRLKNVRRITLENGLRKALENEEFSIHYQPQVDLGTGNMVGVEALLRWEHPELGNISPSEFIPIAEESDLITHIGNWVLMKACEQAVAWQKEGYPPITLAVNISARQLQTKYQFIQTVKAILGITKLDPSLLELEVTEGMMKDIKAAMPVLQELKGLGIQVSIDDFGTGYSALNLLRQFPIDKLKIDQSFIRESMENKVSASLIKTMIAMGHDLNFHVIAEGIETKDQLSFLKENKCNAGQGYLYSRPVPAEQIIPLLKNVQMSF